MALNLVDCTSQKSKLHPLDVVERELWPAPSKKDAMAQYWGWLADWGVALMLTAGMVNVWLEFIGPLSFLQLSSEASQVFEESSQYLTWIVAPIMHFCLNHLCLANLGQTFGQRLFGIAVSGAEKSLSWEESMLYSGGQTVSCVSFGTTVFLIDQLVGTHTTTASWQHWNFSVHARAETNTSVDLVKQAEANTPAQDFQKAA